MESLPLGEMSVAVTAIVALALIVKYFLHHLTKKDEAFTKTINNHLQHASTSNEKMAGALERLADKLDK